jgi:uncharacterized YccA/Bax inhibitor family protein
MRTSNPALNENVFAKETPGALRAGWASPAPDTVSPWPPAPAPAGPLDTDQYRVMRMGGVVSASALLLLLVVAAGWFGWQAVTVVEGTDAVTGERVVVDASIPAWVFGAVVVGFLLAIVTIFVPKVARFTAPVYAVAEGVFLGAISHYYELAYEGIVLQAVGLTVGVFATMLFLFATRVIRVTRKFMVGVCAATGAVALVYLASFLVRLVGSDIPFIHDAGPLGIGFSLVVVVIAALNLVLDFDFIEKGVAMHAPRRMEWYAAFGLLVTLVWLYLELLRLLSKLRSR